MKFLHTDFDGGSSSSVIVTLNNQANVMLLSDAEFCAYRGGRRFQYHGGWAATSPVRLRPPSAGHLHVVVDLGGRAGQVRAGIRVMQDRG